MANGDDNTLADKIRRFRERVQRTETSRRAERRASARRVREGEPEGVSEAAKVRARQAKETAQETTEEASGLASDAKSLLSSELGISETKSASLISEGARLLEEAGDQVGELGLDGDGDTDILDLSEETFLAPEESDLEMSAVDPVDTSIDFDASEPLDGGIKF